MFLAAADVVALPQRLNRVSMAQVPGKVFEAMAMARPILATAVSDLPEILDGAARVVEPGSVEALTEGLADLLRQPSAAEDLVMRRAPRCIERYSWDAMERTFAECFPGSAFIDARERMRRVLMIHYNFPPLGGVASVRAAKMARYLEEFGWTPIIVAPARGRLSRGPEPRRPRGAGDPHGEPRVGEGRQAHRLRRSASERRPKSPARISQALRTLVHRVLYIPDAQIGWYPFALRAARRAMREERVDALFSSSPPVSAHLDRAPPSPGDGHSLDRRVPRPVDGLAMERGLAAADRRAIREGDRRDRERRS